MRRRAFVMIVAAGLAGCVPAPPTPKPFSGPVAKLQTTASGAGMFANQYIFVANINGADFYKPVSPLVDYMAIRGKTDVITGSFAIPANSPSTFTLVGETAFDAPVFCLSGDDYQVSGTVTFTPVANATYIEYGRFSKPQSRLWVEDAATHTVMANFIVEGSTALTLSQKMFGHGNILFGSGGACPLTHVNF